MLRIRIIFHADPDPGSQKCSYGSGSWFKGGKIKEDNLYQYQQFSTKIFQNDIKLPLKISKHNVLQKDQCCGSASSIMWIRILDPKNVHPDPEADPDPRG